MRVTRDVIEKIYQHTRYLTLKAKLQESNSQIDFNKIVLVPACTSPKQPSTHDTLEVFANCCILSGCDSSLTELSESTVSATPVPLLVCKKHAEASRTLEVVAKIKQVALQILSSLQIADPSTPSNTPTEGSERLASSVPTSPGSERSQKTHTRSPSEWSEP